MDLQAIREHAQLLLHTQGLEGHGATLLGLVGNAERAHFEEVTALRLALRDLLDHYDDPCYFDHHGYCQAHGIAKPCAVDNARKVLDGDRDSGWMRLWDAASEAYQAYGYGAMDPDQIGDVMSELGQALAEHKAKWAPA